MPSGTELPIPATAQGGVPDYPRVLVVDDDPIVLAATSSLLGRRRLRCDTIQTGLGVVERAVAFGADVVLLDLQMEPISGAAVLANLRRDHRTALIPVICVTGDADPAKVVALLMDGADDYICKPFRADELAARILVAVRRRAALGSVNPLSGLPGNVVLRNAIEQRLGEDRPFALLHVDIDNFKDYNDRYGFVHGDRVIAALGRLLRDAVSGVDGGECLVAHIGGDDFAVLMPSGEAEAMALTILEAFDRLAAELYETDEARGHTETDDRRRRAQYHPTLSLSIGLATTGHRTFPSAAAMADVAGEVKAAAKRRDGSALVVDRRTA